MADKIFINYRREDSIGTAGRLRDRLAEAFGEENLFMDVDNIPAGVDFVTNLNSQVAACRVFLAVIGPDWLDAKDESGVRRLDNPDDFVTIEIAAALARDIRVIPVLVDNARMPKADKLPEPIRPLVRRNAVEVRNTQFRRDAETLVARMREALVGREALSAKAAGPGWWRTRAAVGVAAVAVLLLIGWGGYAFVGRIVEQGVQRVELKREQERKAELEATRKAEEAEQQRLAAAKAEQEWQAAAKAEQERQARAAADPEAKRKAEAANAVRQAKAAFDSRDYDRAITDLNEAIRLDPKDAAAFSNRGLAYARKGDYDRAITDYNEAIRLNPRYALAFYNRGLAYVRKGDDDRAIADYNEAIRLNPQYALAFYSRGTAYGKKGDHDRAIADLNEAIRLDPKYAPAFTNRGLTYARKGDPNRAIADYNEAIRLDPKDALSFCNRGITKRETNDSTANDDIAKARELGKLDCR